MKVANDIPEPAPVTMAVLLARDSAIGVRCLKRPKWYGWVSASCLDMEAEKERGLSG